MIVKLYNIETGTEYYETPIVSQGMAEDIVRMVTPIIKDTKLRVSALNDGLDVQETVRKQVKNIVFIADEVLSGKEEIKLPCDHVKPHYHNGKECHINRDCDCMKGR